MHDLSKTLAGMIVHKSANGIMESKHLTILSHLPYERRRFAIVRLLFIVMYLYVNHFRVEGIESRAAHL